MRLIMAKPTTKSIDYCVERRFCCKACQDAYYSILYGEGGSSDAE